MSEISRACGGGDTDRSLVPGALRGYRTWRPVRRRAELPPGMLPISSLSRRGVVWPTQLEAHCTPPDVGSKAFGGSILPGDHPAPYNGCECGIYAWYDPRDTRILHARVFGVVEASGLVLLGDRGFRAQKARVAAVVTRSRRVAAACTEAGVEVFRSRRQLVKAYPPEDVSALIGPVDEGTDPLGPQGSNGVGDNGGVPGRGGLGLPGAPATLGMAGGVPVPPSAAASAGARQGPAGWWARRRTRRLPPPPGMDRKLVMAVWARTAVVAVAVAALPTPVGIVSALVAEVALIAVVATRLR